MSMLLEVIQAIAVKTGPSSFFEFSGIDSVRNERNSNSRVLFTIVLISMAHTLSLFLSL
jgi:hypothetical protein